MEEYESFQEELLIVQPVANEEFHEGFVVGGIEVEQWQAVDVLVPTTGHGFVEYRLDILPRQISFQKRLLDHLPEILTGLEPLPYCLDQIIVAS